MNPWIATSAVVGVVLALWLCVSVVAALIIGAAASLGDDAPGPHDVFADED